MNSDEWTVVEKGARRRKQEPTIPHDGAISYCHYPPAKLRRRGNSASSLSPQQKTEKNVASITSALARTAWWKELSSELEVVRKGRRTCALQCLGMGSFANSANARHQLACALLMKRLLVNPPVCSITDPAMTEEDVTFACHLGFEVVSAKSHLVRIPSTGCCTVLFMPHCGRELNELVMSQCLESGSDGVIFIANSFSRYVTETIPARSTPESSIIQDLYDSNALCERPCADARMSTREFAFNDLAITTVDVPSGQKSRLRPCDEEVNGTPSRANGKA